MLIYQTAAVAAPALNIEDREASAAVSHLPKTNIPHQIANNHLKAEIKFTGASADAPIG